MNIRSRARGCLLGQLADDALGSLVEFETPEAIRRRYPDGVRELADGGTWNTIAGQPTDDSEMALLLARMLVKRGTYDQAAAFEAYVYWLDSGPFDCGMTISAGLRGQPNLESQANGALMRVSPLGIFGAQHELEKVASWATADAALTHPICGQINALFATALASTIRDGADANKTYQCTLARAEAMHARPEVIESLRTAATAPPTEYNHQQGWVLIAFQNAFWQLLHAPTLEEGVVDTVMRGGNTDTNAAIAGALLGAVHGAVHGVDAVPQQWTDRVLSCRPQSGRPRVMRPRPPCFWPVDALEHRSTLEPFLAKQARRS